MNLSSSGSDAIKRLQQSAQQHVLGHEQFIERLTIALLTGGHCLIEGPPGVAKTRTVNVFSQLVNMTFARVQATPDLLPADLTGTDMYRQETGQFEFLPGPLFNHLILVDEINRAPPKVQSALLEAMAEQQITTGNTTRPLPKPFLVAATQNPLEHEGTYPLPEAQLDRFMFHIELSLPNAAQERAILDHSLQDSLQTTDLIPVAQHNDITDAINAVRQVHVSPAIRDYIVRLTDATRPNADSPTNNSHIAHPASPRGTLYLAHAAQAKAWLANRDHVQPDDVLELAGDVLSGRIALTYKAQASGKTARDVIATIVENTAVV